MSTRDIQAQLQELYGVEVSPGLISNSRMRSKTSVNMESNFDQDKIEHIQVNSLAELDQLVSQKFELPQRPDRKSVV